MHTDIPSINSQGNQKKRYTYPKCSKQGHNFLDLNFISRKEMNDVKSFYCSKCVKELFPEMNTNTYEIISLDDLFEIISSFTNLYSEQLDPLVENYYRKYQEVSENDFREMFEELTYRSEDFRKTLDGFQNKIAILCTNFETLFQKRLETLFYESLINIDVKLSASRKAFEILQLKLRTYGANIDNNLREEQDIDIYQKKINLLLKDFGALKNNNVLEELDQIGRLGLTSSSVVDKFRNGCNFDSQIGNISENILAYLTQKFKVMQRELNLSIIKLNHDYQSSKSSNQKDQRGSENIIRKRDENENEHHNDENEREDNIDVISNLESIKASLTEPLLTSNIDDLDHRNNDLEEINQTRSTSNSAPLYNLIAKEANSEAYISRNSTSDKGPKEEVNNAYELKLNALNALNAEQLRDFAASLILKVEKKLKG